MFSVILIAEMSLGFCECNRLVRFPLEGSLSVKLRSSCSRKCNGLLRVFAGMSVEVTLVLIVKVNVGRHRLDIGTLSSARYSFVSFVLTLNFSG